MTIESHKLQQWYQRSESAIARNREKGLEQVPGYLMWLEQRDDGWHVIGAEDESMGGPFPTARSALLNAKAMTNTSGT